MTVFGLKIGSEELRSVLVWLVYFLALEVPSHLQLGRVQTAAACGLAVGFAVWANPTFTLSRSVWGGIAWWHPLADFVLVFACVLVAHLLYRISAAYLIAVGIAIAAASLWHWKFG